MQLCTERKNCEIFMILSNGFDLPITYKIAFIYLVPGETINTLKSRCTTYAEIFESTGRNNTNCKLRSKNERNFREVDFFEPKQIPGRKSKRMY